MLKYLGVTLQKNCRFTEHVLKICDSAERMMRNLNALMSKERAPRASKRRVLASTVTSAMLYAVPAWWSAFIIGRNRDRMKKIHRGVLLGVVLAYRTVSYEALRVLSGVFL
ncbi:uncharacterized protein LOC142332743 [Lycorma delicatula]|uniref:uncharacterized protein LOC142332743 n=1 Tax=Lycorma delicatula TaxID=130591 RepID=UPI003F5134D1